MKTFVEFLTEAPRSVWFHGTSIKRLHAILKQGLIPDPKKREWADDPGAGISTPSRQSYGGIYVTQNLMTALGAPRDRVGEGRQVVVVMELQPNTFYLDEDELTGPLNAPLAHVSDNEYHIATYWLLANHPGDNQADIDEKIHAYIESVLRFIKHKMETLSRELAPQLETRLRSLLPGVWKAALGRLAAHVAARMADYDYKRYLAVAYGDKYWNQAIPPRNKMFPTVEQGEAGFRQAAGQLTRTLHQLATPENGAYGHNARVTEPIGYSGSNHIIAVIEVRDSKQYRGDDYKKPAQLIMQYGNMPGDFLEQWRSRVGGNFQVVKPQPR